MAISILPARLANQIAAGEVVERPASVVKELVENAIDAGASKIIIDIEKGGSKRIRITDNGHGIVKDELTLALSRHATSKIKSLDDLEAIGSLGFRGEALASISSVSRLTLTSKPAAQQAAWQATAVGRDMSVDVKPAAHPDGTTIDVEDLFFNTPARRKFLRTEKTEFAHIDEVIKRIALSNLQLTLIVNHNAKAVRSYRSAKTDKQIEKRIAAICSQAFIDNAIALQYQHAGMRLWGWIATPQFARSHNDLSYSYVNGRMMRDKLINHAIRQAYGHRLANDTYPAFVLYLELSHSDVDVNVHPAKHEVRFHQARLVHDFIVAAVEQTLQSDSSFDLDRTTGEVIDHDDRVQADRSSQQAERPHVEPASTSYVQPLRHGNDSAQYAQQSTNASSAYSQKPNYGQRVSERAVDNYRKLLSVADQVEIADAVDDRRPSQPSNQQQRHASEPMSSLPSTDSVFDPSCAQTSAASSIDSELKLFKVIVEHVVLLEWQGKLYCCNFQPLRQQLFHLQLSSQYPQGLVSQPLLLPVAIKIDSKQQQFIEQHSRHFEFIGVHVSVSTNKVVIRQYPAQLREQDISESFSDLLSLQMRADKVDHDVDWLAAIATLKCQQAFELAMVEKLLASANAVQNFDLFAYMRLNSKTIDLTSEAQLLLS